MRHMRRVEIAHPLAAEVEHLAVGQRARRPVGQVVERDHAAERAVGHLRLRGGGQPLVHRAALVGFDMAEARSSAAARAAGCGATASATSGNIRRVAAVEQQRLVGA